MTSHNDIGGRYEQLRAENLERMKELATLNRTTQVLRENKSPEETLKHICMILPDGWQYPAFTGARIMYNDQIYLSPNFILSEWRQMQEFETIDGKKGYIEISYSKAFPVCDEGPFLEEERDLLLNLANLISGYLNSLKGKQVKLCGMAKGAGMIRPRLATMLSFLVTDAHIKAPLLQRMLEKAVEVSYNRITIDGETSTNDTVLLLANGRAGHPSLSHMDRDGEIFQSMLLEVCQNLAESLVKDGEGATKLIEILIQGARNKEDAKQAAYTVAHSPLVKTAFFGEDVNWGRILCALGHSGAQINPNRIDVFFDKAPIVKNGMGIGARLEEKAGQIIKKKSFKVIVDLHQGKSHFSVLTTDLSLDYVKINASYRS